MAAELRIPDHLRDAVDAAIAGFHEGIPNQLAEKVIKDWVLSDDAYSDLAEGDDPIAMLCDLTHTDADIRSQLGLEDNDEITDWHRIEYAREIFETVRNDSSATYIDARLLKDGEERGVYLVLSSFSAGQAGLQWGWLGLYGSLDTLIENLIEEGFIIDNFLQNGKKFDDYSNEELIYVMLKAFKKTIF